MPNPSNGQRWSSSQTVIDLLREWLIQRNPNGADPLSARTWRDYQGLVDRWVAGTPLAGTPIGRVTTPMAIQFLSGITAGSTDRTRGQVRAVLSSAFSWAVINDRVAANPWLSIPRSGRGKAGAAPSGRVRTPVLPTWAEFACLVEAPVLRRDRLLLALLGWGGLRWTEAISLEPRDLGAQQPSITVERVWVYDSSPSDPVDPESTPRGWIIEAPKAGRVGSLRLPHPLWSALAAHAAQARPLGEPAISRIFQPRDSRGGPGLLLDSNWREPVWLPARDTAGLGPNPSLSDSDPRHGGMIVKDLRAFAASVLVDSGATTQEAQKHLRHGDASTTSRHYVHAADQIEHDADRASLRIDRSLPMQARLDALWESWARRYPSAAESLTS